MEPKQSNQKIGPDQTAGPKKETPTQQKRERKYKSIPEETPEETKARKEADRIENRKQRVSSQIKIAKQLNDQIVKENTTIAKSIQPKRNYTPEEKENILNNIIQLVTQGESLFKSCAKNKISTQTFFNWTDQNKTFLDSYARAYALRADSLFDKAVDVAVNMPDVNRARLVIDTVKWVVGKINPNKYSDKQTINIIGNVNQNITTMDPDDRNKKIMELMQKAGNIIDISPE